jgi:hypothetical protein
MRKNIVRLALFGLSCLFATQGFAAPNVAFVSFLGADTYPCSRLLPCRTITHALSVVAAGGAVDIVASGTYDTFTVTKANTVAAEPGVLATINVPLSGTGITVNAGASDVVMLRGLTLHGTSGTGVGIAIQKAGLTTVEDCVSKNFDTGLQFTPTVASTLSLKGGSYQGSTNGIFLCCASVPGLNASIDSTHVYGGTYTGINTDGQQITITRSSVTGLGSGSTGIGILVAHGKAVIESSIVSAYAFGIFSAEGDATAYLSSCTVTDNDNGVVIGLGQLFTRGNNTVISNNTDVTGGTPAPFSAQ